MLGNLRALLIVTALLLGFFAVIHSEPVHARYQICTPPERGAVITGAPEPSRQQKTIRMDSIKVIMRLKPNSYTVDAVFALYNPGETTTEQIRFPKQGDTGYCPIPDTPAFMRFDLWVNGRETQVTEWRDTINSVKASLQRLVPSQWLGEPPGIVRSLNSLLSPGIVNWLLAKVTFPARAMTTIRLSCEGTYFAWYNDSNQATFILETVSKWKGKIRNASFTIDCTEVGGLRRCDVGLRRFTPEWKAHITKNTIRYQKSNYDHLERQDVISVSFGRGTGMRRWTEDSAL